MAVIRGRMVSTQRVGYGTPWCSGEGCLSLSCRDAVEWYKANKKAEAENHENGETKKGKGKGSSQRITKSIHPGVRLVLGHALDQIRTWCRQRHFSDAKSVVPSAVIAEGVSRFGLKSRAKMTAAVVRETLAENYFVELKSLET